MAEERRRFQRVKVNLLGRYMLSDRREFPCQVTDISAPALPVRQGRDLQAEIHRAKEGEKPPGLKR